MLIPERRDHANEQSVASALKAVTDNVDQSKGARAAAEWLPQLANCRSATAVVLVKCRYRLSVNPAAQAALRTGLGNLGHLLSALRSTLLGAWWGYWDGGPPGVGPARP